MSEKSGEITVECGYEWTKISEQTLLITTTATYSDGDVKTIRYQVGLSRDQNGVQASHLPLKRKLFIEQLQVRILEGALAGKNSPEVTIASSWTDIKREAGRTTFTHRVNYSNWDTMLFSTTLMSAKPSQREIEQVTLAHAAQAEQFRLIKQWRQAK